MRQELRQEADGRFASESVVVRFGGQRSRSPSKWVTAERADTAGHDASRNDPGHDQVARLQWLVETAAVREPSSRVVVADSQCDYTPRLSYVIVEHGVIRPGYSSTASVDEALAHAARGWRGLDRTFHPLARGCGARRLPTGPGHCHSERSTEPHTYGGVM
jgi:hypothetical protein